MDIGMTYLVSVLISVVFKSLVLSVRYQRLHHRIGLTCMRVCSSQSVLSVTAGETWACAPLSVSVSVTRGYMPRSCVVWIRIWLQKIMRNCETCFSSVPSLLWFSLSSVFLVPPPWERSSLLICLSVCLWSMCCSGHWVSSRAAILFGCDSECGALVITRLNAINHYESVLSVQSAQITSHASTTRLQ